MGVGVDHPVSLSHGFLSVSSVGDGMSDIGGIGWGTSGSRLGFIAGLPAS